MLAIVGIPLFFLELAFGQFASLGPITIWRINPLLKGNHFAMILLKVSLIFRHFMQHMKLSRRMLCILIFSYHYI